MSYKVQYKSFFIYATLMGKPKKINTPGLYIDVENIYVKQKQISIT